MTEIIETTAKKRLLNAANLHVGGCVQVAASVVSELSAAKADCADITDVELFLSDEVAHNAQTSHRAEIMSRSVIRNLYGFDLGNRAVHREMDAFDTVFTLFGPLYCWKPRFRSIVGFAQPWIIYPDNECYSRLSIWERFKTRLKFRIQSMFFKRADVLVVELEHVKQGVIRRLGFPPERVHVVHNCLSGIYRNQQAWEPVSMPEAECELRLGFLGRNYMHKNTRIFPEIVQILSERYDIDSRFYVTFTEKEWADCTPQFREACINVGPLTVAQCPSFYKSLHAIVFPSLLECFSVTPLEAMAMELPLFASDRPFNRDVCDEFAHYFDPLKPETAARKIAAVFGGDGPSAAILSAAREHAFSFASPAGRAKQYLELLGQDESAEE